MGEKKIIIDPRVIQHLGRDLITSPEVAIIELIKNSIDAKSKAVNIHLFDNFDKVLQANNFLSEIPKEINNFVPDELKKSTVLIVEDLGCGMSTTQLETGFLKIGTNIKSEKTDEDALLGEKGIGRLATQRLGNALIVETASEDEDFTSFTYLNWSEIVKGKEFVPYEQINKFSTSYTRLWIFNVNFEDILEYPTQLSFNFEDEIEIALNRELQSALNFLVSPFKSDISPIDINVFFDSRKVDIGFPEKMLALSESTHYFSLEKGRNNEVVLNYGLVLQPWFIERIHRALVKADGFARLKKPHSYYSKLLEDNLPRIEQILNNTLEVGDLCEIVAEFYEEIYPNVFEKRNKENYYEYFSKKALDDVSRMSEIVPIIGEIYSFKQNAAIGENIIIESVKEQDASIKDIDLKKLKLFLENYNGIKLYRGNYRIGFLGNKESDWIRLQQYRTKGQQWFRFDLGNTVGYVSLNDPHQERIQEISSRLDISQNNVSEAFKLLINIVFNKLFYELNQKANAIVKIILEENNLLGESLVKRVKKNSNIVQQMIKRNKKMKNTIKEISKILEKQVVIDGSSASMPKETYDSISKVMSDINDHIQEDQETQNEAAKLLAEADKQLRIIEVESYNNYKLMANGLITETITHELHSLSTTNTDNQVHEYFDFLKRYFSEIKEAKIYNNYVYPIKNNYNVISSKMNQIGDMYSFLEKTFIKKGTYDDFVHQDIKEIVEQVYSNLLKTTKINKIDLKCKTDLSWFVPKGVLIHVFFNLFSNSKYWIDVRRKRAEKDRDYIYRGIDQIIVEQVGDDGLSISDTGTGVSPNMQDILFEPLQSGKPYNEGRGMGLYIVKKMMNSFGGDIILLPDKNEFGNRYKFLLMRDKSEEI